MLVPMGSSGDFCSDRLADILAAAETGCNRFAWSHHHATVILRCSAPSPSLEGWAASTSPIAHPSRLAQEGSHLRMTAARYSTTSKKAPRGGFSNSDHRAP